MENLEKIHNTIKIIAKDSNVNIFKIDKYTFNVVINGELMDSFEKFGEIQNKIEKICSDEYTLITVYGDNQDAQLILKKN